MVLTHIRGVWLLSGRVLEIKGLQFEPDITEKMLTGMCRIKPNKQTHISQILWDISKQRRMQPLISFCTVCLQNVLLLKLEKNY